MNNKIIASLVIAGVLASGSGVIATASTINPNTKQAKTEISTQVNQKINNQQEAVKLIQNKYLEQEPNGTFKININAKKYINDNIFNQIEQSVQLVNKNILENNVQFKMKKNNGNVAVTATKVTNKYKEIISNNISKNFSNVSSNPNIENFNVMINQQWINDNLYDVTYTWYGGYGDADSASYIAQLCNNNGNTDWGNTAQIAANYGYTLTVTFNNAFGITAVSY